MEINTIIKKTNKIEKVRLNDVFNSIIILIVLISAGFVDEIAGCSLTKLTRHMYIKHIIVYFIIYITIDLQVDDKISPLENIKNSFKIWILYILFTKLDKRFTLVVIALLICDYIINSYKKYYYLNKDNDNGDKYNLYLEYLQHLIMGLLFIGFLSYLYKQYKDHRKKFNLLTFFLGTDKCS